MFKPAARPLLRPVVLVLLALPAPASAGSVYVGLKAYVSDHHFPSTPPVSVYESAPILGGSFSTGPVTNPLLGNSASIHAMVSTWPAPVLSVDATARGAPNPDHIGINSDYEGAGAYGGASMSYEVSIVGPGPAKVPLEISGVTQGDLHEVVGSGAGKVSSGISFEKLSAASVSSLGDPAPYGYSFFYPDGTLYYSASFGYDLNQSGDHSFWSSYLFAMSVTGGSTFTVNLSAGVDIADGHDAGASADVSIDPLIAIDPTWLASHPGYSVVVESGFGNALPLSVPEPASYAMMLAGFALIGAISRRRTRNRRSICRDGQSKAQTASVIMETGPVAP